MGLYGGPQRCPKAQAAVLVRGEAMGPKALVIRTEENVRSPIRRGLRRSVGVGGDGEMRIGFWRWSKLLRGESRAGVRVPLWVLAGQEAATRAVVRQDCGILEICWCLVDVAADEGHRLARFQAKIEIPWLPRIHNAVSSALGREHRQNILPRRPHLATPAPLHLIQARSH